MLDLSYRYIIPLMHIVLKVLFIIVPLLVLAAYLTYAERRIIGLMQMRRGPNVAGPFGLFQPIADGLKLIFKESIVPEQANKKVFIIAPMTTFILSLVGWAVIPFSKGVVLSNINVGVLYIIAVSSLGVYGIIMAGWASNSKYAFLGAIRSSAQMISYEVSMGVIVTTVILVTGTLNLSEIVEYQQKMPFWINLLLTPMHVVFFISTLAETNRLPFDLPEAESELVAGYHVEYSSMNFALFFLAEYINMMFLSAITVTFFMGGYLPPFNINFLYIVPGFFWFVFKVCLLLFIFLWTRATLPRYRYDQLMHLGWKVFLPLSLFWLVIVALMLLITGNLP